MTKSNKPSIVIHDLATDEVVTRQMDNTEFIQWQKDQAESKKAEAEAEAKATARQAILDRLGLTADEAALLLG